MSNDLTIILERIRKAVLDHVYVMTSHAYDEMRADHLSVPDVESALLTGTIERVLTDDPDEPRYEIVGQAVDLLARVGVVVMIRDKVVIITVYEKRR